MIDRYKDSFYRKLSLDRDTMELIRVFNKLKKEMLKEIEGKKTYE